MNVMTLRRADAPHHCAPPLEVHTRHLPATDEDDPEWAMPEQTWTEQTPPPPGSTWDCPSCGQVWVVRVLHGEQGGSYIVGHVRLWELAGWLERRHHAARLRSVAQTQHSG